MKKIALAAALLLSTASTASANWLYQEHGSAFSENKTHLGLAISGRYAFGLRCSGSDDLEGVYLTGEAMSADEAETANILSPEMLVRIDQNDVVAFPVQAMSRENQLQLFGAVPDTLMPQIHAASRSVSVAVRLGGQLFHEAEFSARASTATMDQLKAKCGL